MTHVILRANQVMEKTKIGRTYLYQEIKAGRFPKPISLGAKAVGWIESEVDAWIDALIEIRNQSSDGNANRSM
ncbi:helix-turn-helix transcriptional regulator [Collimonas sp.]|jgi:prophage regulatory protein|uniref:helix-turn-helix transcriptional regulator n=1 Tax=Collimonas sp. TaxID=1963772 RepID=UPI0037C0EC29